MSKGPITDWDEILNAEFRYLSWDVFQFLGRQEERFELEQALGDRVLKPFDRKKKVVYISRRVNLSHLEGVDHTWEYIKGRAPSLSQKFDGFFIYDSCVPYDLDGDEHFVLRGILRSLFDAVGSITGSKKSQAHCQRKRKAPPKDYWYKSVLWYSDEIATKCAD